MGVDGNFIFTNAFLNAWKYFYQLSPELKKTAGESALFGGLAWARRHGLEVDAAPPPDEED